jgi:hypothetical protein
MIHEKPVECYFCQRKHWFAVYCQKRKIYVCPKCCKKVGHEPPFTAREIYRLTNPKDGV